MSSAELADCLCVVPGHRDTVTDGTFRLTFAPRYKDTVMGGPENKSNRKILDKDEKDLKN